MLDTTWRKSSRSGANGACVEARLFADGVEVRDSKDVSGPTLRTGAHEWTELLSITKRSAR
ncbi:uncharacterized protein DUF397 [Stackebrandtia endophytica]|uniref:Uncharacterized protein DUF397 n=1 Tax=Stackebrandtia endophytica TaxID=1496996 RepID=A0A543ASE4_9ACTN|nr:DUF397 domain-containing protein [Stackebrandtia endophytica]TQL75498.1 uncharacterized protein DUF397 [Stackebrandtia endophytica]